MKALFLPCVRFSGTLRVPAVHPVVPYISPAGISFEMTPFGHKESVDNVHTFRLELARTGIGLARIACVSATSQCF